MTRLPALAKRYPAVSPVTPPPTTTTSAVAPSLSFANRGNDAEIDQNGVVSMCDVAMNVPHNDPSVSRKGRTGRRPLLLGTPAAPEEQSGGYGDVSFQHGFDLLQRVRVFFGRIRDDAVGGGVDFQIALVR